MDYKFLLECKNDLFNFLSSMLINPIYSGIRGMYDYSAKMHTILEEKCKLNNKIVNPGIVSILKLCLNDITSLNNYEIENIYNDIKQQSGCYNYFDDLVRACFKSYILLLTYNPVYETSKFSSPELYENIVVKDFIHRCYIEVSNYFKDNIELIIKDRKREIHHIIKDCIEHSIKKSISNYDEIIKEYLKIKFDISKKEDRMSYDNIKSMVSRMIDTQKYGSVGGGVGGAGGSSVGGGGVGSGSSVGGGSGGESSFNNVENFINANKELDAIVKNSYIDGSGGGDSTKSAQQLSGKNYILNTQSNENSTTMQLQEATSNIINVGINKDKEIDNILNNNLEPINEEVGVVKEVNVVKEGGHNAHARVFSLTSTSINDDKTFINDDKTSINDDKTSINDDKTSINDDKTSINEGTNKTSLLESPMPIRNNKINDILPTVKKGRPSKNKNADKFFNNLA